MKFTVDLTINKNRRSVWKAFDNPNNTRHWQPTLQSFEPQKGTPGQVGAISKLTYREDGQTITLLETITDRDEPNEFSGIYARDGVVNELRNTFVELNAQQTRWILDADLRFSGVLSLVAPLMKKSLVKRTRADMERFKAMVENQAR